MTMHDQITPGIEMIPLGELALSPLNPRQTIDESEIEEMAESLAVCGLVQNLIGLRQDGHVEIIGGGKRLRALQRLAEDGWTCAPDMPPIDPVPVRVTDDPLIAHAWAGAENHARSDMHPADEVRNYAAMRDAGSTPRMIARAFAKTERHVAQRLKLADLPEAALDALRANRISLDQAAALTVAPNEERCLATLEAVVRSDMHPARIRDELMGKSVPASDRRARYVGEEAYLAAGGEIDADLFTTASWWLDEKLLAQLFEERAKAHLERVRADEGWNWATFDAEAASHPYLKVGTCETLHGEPFEMTDGDLAELERLSEQDEDTLSEDEIARKDALQEQYDREVYTDEQLETGGIFGYVGRDGRLNIARGFRRPEDAPQHESETDDDTIEVKVDAPKPAKPQNLLQDLSRVRLASIQTALLDQHELLLDLAALSFLPEVSPWRRPLAFLDRFPDNEPEVMDGVTISERLQEAHAQWRDDVDSALSELRAEGKAHRNRILASGLARAYSRETGPIADALAELITINARKVWTPTAKNFFGRIRADLLDDIWRELAGKDNADLLAGKTKKDKAAELEKLFGDDDYREALGLSRAQNAAIDAWVPEELRFGAAEKEPADA